MTFDELTESLLVAGLAYWYAKDTQPDYHPDAFGSDGVLFWPEPGDHPAGDWLRLYAYADPTVAAKLFGAHGDDWWWLRLTVGDHERGLS